MPTPRTRTPLDLIAGVGRYLLHRHRGTARAYRHARTIEQNLFRSADDLGREQDRRLADIVNHAYHNSPFYRRRFAAVGFRPGDVHGRADLRSLPVVSKPELVHNIDDILCLPAEQLKANTTGGTTGVAFKFYRDPRCLDLRLGIDLATMRYYGWRDGQWQAWLWGATRDMVQPASFKSWLAHHVGDRQIFFEASSITAESYRAFVRRALRHRPVYLSAYPSLAYDLACRIEAGEVEPIRFPVVTMTAEPTYDFQRAKILEFLADEVYERYGSRECGMAALECPAHNGMHYFTESVYFETRRDSETLPSRHLYITDLLNYGMPFIRYDVGDYGDIDEQPCPCGRNSPRLIHICGRVVETVWSPDGHGTSGMMIVSCVRRAQIHTPVQIVQERIDHVEIRVEGPPGSWAAQLTHLVKLFSEEVSADITWEVVWVDKIDRSESGKYRYVISSVKPPAEKTAHPPNSWE